MNNSKHPLTGNWRSRLQAKLRELGFEAIQDFLAQYPGLPYLEVPEKLGKEVVVPISISTLQFEEAKKAGTVRDAAMDCLVREINYHLKSGWEKRKHYDPTTIPAEIQRIEFQTASAFADWATELQMTDKDLQPFIDATWNALELKQPPVGWHPSGPLDPLIVAAFKKGWPQ